MALTLVEQLHASGHKVWIDHAGINAATSWSKEIAEALEDCGTFMVLLSPRSLASENVAKELAVAAELRKHIIPIELESITLKREFLYHLTGLQRVSHTNFDSILHAIEKHRGGESLAASGQTSLPAIEEPSGALRIAVLPFEDQSPAHDNEWFSDGLTDELISTLGKLEQLFVVDSQSSRIYKAAKLPTKEIAGQLRVRYIVRGAVRKAANKIRIQATLIDSTNGQTLWDEKFDGTMDDIFEIQEQTAIDITQGLRLKLTKAEVAELEYRGTENAEAYEWYLKAVATMGMAYEDQMRALSWLQQAILLDPNYADAYGSMAVLYANMYRGHGRKPETLQLQKEATEKAVQFGPNNIATTNALANLYSNLGNQELAIKTARKMIETAPGRSRGYSVTGFMHQVAGRFSEAATYYEQALTMDPGSLNDHNNVLASYHMSNQPELLKKGVLRAAPYYEQYLALHPADQSVRCNYMVALESINGHDLSLREAERLLSQEVVFGYTHYQVASVYARQGKNDLAIAQLRQAAQMGVIDFNELEHDKEWYSTLHALPDFASLVTELKALVAQAGS